MRTAATRGMGKVSRVGRREWREGRRTFGRQQVRFLLVHIKLSRDGNVALQKAGAFRSGHDCDWMWSRDTSELESSFPRARAGGARRRVQLWRRLTNWSDEVCVETHLDISWFAQPPYLYREVRCARLFKGNVGSPLSSRTIKENIDGHGRNRRTRVDRQRSVTEIRRDDVSDCSSSRGRFLMPRNQISNGQSVCNRCASQPPAARAYVSSSAPLHR